MRHRDRSEKTAFVSTSDDPLDDAPTLTKTLRQGSGLSHSAVLCSADRRQDLRASEQKARTPQLEAELREGDCLFEQYVVERVVGKMGRCVLVKLRHARLEQRFWLKYLTHDASQEPGAVSEFLHGARLAMKLQSEHAVRTIDAGRLASGLPYIVTEAFQGSELRELLRIRGALAQSEAVDFLLQAAHAVAEAHRHGLAHGTLSPSTLFVTRREDGLPVLKVFEFGSAETLRADPLSVKLQKWNRGTAIFWESTRLWDTLLYSAPEQVRAARETTQRTDVYALGAVLHELLSGVAPFSAANSVSLLAGIVADAPPPLTSLCPGVPRALERIVLCCLSKEPHARFASVADLATALHPFASSDGRRSVERIVRIQCLDDTQSAPLSTPRAASRSIHAPERRTRRILTLAVTLLLLGLLFGLLARLG